MVVVNKFLKSPYLVGGGFQKLGYSRVKTTFIFAVIYMTVGRLAIAAPEE